MYQYHTKHDKTFGIFQILISRINPSMISENIQGFICMWKFHHVWEKFSGFSPPTTLNENNFLKKVPHRVWWELYDGDELNFDTSFVHFNVKKKVYAKVTLNLTENTDY